MPMSNALTIEDLEALPNDGRRYELIGGAIVMTPAPEPVHQHVVLELAVLLRAALPPGQRLFVAPIDYDLPGGQRVEPDLIVVPDASVGKKRLAGPALLVVEIVSPGSRINDRVTKRAAYAEAGIPAYWIVDPGNGQTLALRLVDGQYEPYVDTTGVAGIGWPVPATFRAGDLAQG